MNYVISQGWAFYWGTSEWLASDIREACEIADRLGLIRPIVEQSQYNIFTRGKVEFEYADLYKKYKVGLTTWSPLAYGTLTGKYSNGKPDGSRFSKAAFASRVLTPSYDERVEFADKLKPIAKEMGCSLPQLATAWCMSNEQCRRFSPPRAARREPQGDRVRRQDHPRSQGQDRCDLQRCSQCARDRSSRVHPQTLLVDLSSVLQLNT
ncbi:hypothetical protein PF010_g6424 [Phytophthora fragariae]|uniref:NADP-dependent oxidoreductase domain-containing protein n=1 Tax=Phytophthora fragariae TaxID=53985 RepID=A0A6A3UFE9_9STRA|nr:hypothetical protein PF003_g2270 [Phytophthora fragariae]KAE8942561.1 hypothetical protein PF009_g7684 [Phytophthora fragariae]KAE9123359.1 hypothetical protein PF010_g6424 [Phytophthora fragariae]KAE9123581.1 hypothetical protein PF007_g6998 [Phytophthora fragariae]KAE9149135.1 hypothetical protein PF006_g6358 [Phytophthora fragariae]